MLVVFMGIIKIMALICMSLIATMIFISILINMHCIIDSISKKIEQLIERAFKWYLRGVLRYGNND